MATAVSTRTMAQVLGPFMLVIGASVALRADAMPTVMTAFLDDAPLVLITGAFTLALGLVMIAAHQRWDSAAAFVISLLGWITAIRGAVLLLAADFVGTIAPHVIQFPPALMAGGAVLAALGLWLSFVGFAAKAA